MWFMFFVIPFVVFFVIFLSIAINIFHGHKHITDTTMKNIINTANTISAYAEQKDYDYVNHVKAKEENKTCEYCGSVVKNGSNKCDACGAKIKK